MENEEQKALRTVRASSKMYQRLLGAQRSYDKMLPLEDECSEAGNHKWKLVKEAPDSTQLWKCSRCGKEELA